MGKKQGASAPFSLALAQGSGTLDDWLLKRTMKSLRNGDWGSALADVEQVCRNRPLQALPAILRAKIVALFSESLAARAWYLAWRRDPLDPIVQDGLLQAWLHAGAVDVVRSLGQAFLAQRYPRGHCEQLLSVLLATKPSIMGACWKVPGAIEGIVLTPCERTSLKDTVDLQVATEACNSFHKIPLDGQPFRLELPDMKGVYCVSVRSRSQPESLWHVLSGSPLVFPAVAPSAVVAKQRQHISSKSSPKSAMAPAQDSAQVHIVIPVYRDLDRVKACVTSLTQSLPHNKTRITLTIVNDASPEPEISVWLQQVEGVGLATVLTNPHNLGFIETCNRAMRLHSTGDVLLLNADTMVHGDWIDRMHASLHRVRDIASVTPWSNNGEVTSFPTISIAEQSPSMQQLARIDNAAATLHRRGLVTDVAIPSGCGFAMLMRRQAIDRVGLLDGVELVRGYSEEVDWCRRASAAGYQHLACTGVFVAHAGKASFGYEKHLRVAQNKAVITARYPDYYEKYYQFVRSDPLRQARKALSEALDHSSVPWPTTERGTTDPIAFPNPLPMALPSDTLRVAVWQPTIGTPAAAKILELARYIATLSPSVGLVILGDVTPAYLHTGVVQAFRCASESAELTMFSDGTLIAMLGCKTVLADVPIAVPAGMQSVVLDQDFDPRAWFDTWLESQTVFDQVRRGRRRSERQSVRARPHTLPTNP